MFKSTPRKEHSHDESFTTASKRTQTLSLTQRKHCYPSLQSDKRSNSNQTNKISYKNKAKRLHLQVMPEMDSLQKSANNEHINSPSKSSKCFRAKQDKNYPLKIRGMPSAHTINKLTRIILIDWLIEVALELRISKEALYQAVCCLDRITSQQNIPKTEYQFYGLTCLWLSHKADSRKNISYATAQEMVKGSRDEKWFIETEILILKKLGYKLNVFTMWHQVNMLVCGFEKYFKKEISDLVEWSQWRNRIRWICEGLIMQSSHGEKVQSLLSLSIIYLVGYKLAEQGYFQYKKVLSFCLKLTDHKNLQLLQKSADSIRVWLDYGCGCALVFGGEMHHAQLRGFARQD